MARKYTLQNTALPSAGAWLSHAHTKDHTIVSNSLLCYTDKSLTCIFHLEAEKKKIVLEQSIKNSRSKSLAFNNELWIWEVQRRRHRNKKKLYLCKLEKYQKRRFWLHTLLWRGWTPILKGLTCHFKAAQHNLEYSKKQRIMEGKTYRRN